MNCSRIRILAALLALSGGMAAFAQQKQWPSTLLWRITGKGLSQPSYLFGTMHLQDKRLFQFGDSLYQALEKTEGLATEVNLQEAMDSAVTLAIKNKEESIRLKEELKVDTKRLGKGADTLLKKFGVTRNKITRKQLKEIRDYRISQMSANNEMPTFVDAYLYELARRKQKWTGGIEDVHDQLDITDDMGADLKVEEVLQPDEKFKSSVEQLIGIYLNQDLQTLNEQFVDFGDPVLRDKVLIQRNIKMARRMDSLSAIRPTFFAVGCAHLPGDSGVINMLKARGFIVEPVFSTKKIAAENYASQLARIRWTKVEEEGQLYTVEMPGKPSEHSAFGSFIKMKMYFDASTMCVYMSGSTIGGTENTQDLKEVLQKMSQEMGGLKSRIVTSRMISKQGCQGIEGEIEGLNGVFKVQLLTKGNLLYMLFAGSSKRTNLVPADMDHYFSSFNLISATSKNNWISFGLPEKGFTLSFPGQPKNNTALDKQNNQSNWLFTTYDYMDLPSQLYYLMQVRDLKEGYHLFDDSTVFSSYRTNIGKNADEKEVDSMGLLQGFPTLYYTAVSAKQGLRFKTLNVIRGNRVYTLAVLGSKNADFSLCDPYFNSLKLTDYNEAKWEMDVSVYGFSATVPSQLKLWKEEDSTQTASSGYYYSYDPNTAISYEVSKQPFPKYYWIKDDSTYYNLHIQSYLKKGDSLISQQTIQNGGVKGEEVLIGNSNSSNREKLRFLVSGDTLYTLTAFIPYTNLTDNHQQHFFNDFRVQNEQAPSIYTKKVDQLFKGLRSKDSVEFDQAKRSFERITFTKEDLPYLHQALMVLYPDAEEGYYSQMHYSIAQQVKALADTSTIRFIREHYDGLKGEKEVVKYPVLKVLAGIRTKESYDLLKQLLVNQLPVKGQANGLSYGLSDSLLLTRNLFPELLALSKDSIFCKELVTLTDKLLDSNMISLNDVLPWKKNFIEQAKKVFRNKAQVEENWWDYSDRVSLLGKFNDKESNDLLRQLLKINAAGLKQSVILALLKNGQSVAPVELEAVAKDRSVRLDLYRELNKVNKSQLFPVKYATQKYFAESELYWIASDDEEVSDLTYIGERVTSFMGKKQKFYLFKATYIREDSRESYLAVAGPYPIESKKLIESSDASGLYTDEPFNAGKIDKQFQSYLTETEVYLKEKDSKK